MFVGVEPKLGGYSTGVFTMIEQFTHGGGKLWGACMYGKAWHTCGTAGSSAKAGLHFAPVTDMPR